MILKTSCIYCCNRSYYYGSLLFSKRISIFKEASLHFDNESVLSRLFQKSNLTSELVFGYYYSSNFDSDLPFALDE